MGKNRALLTALFLLGMPVLGALFGPPIAQSPTSVDLTSALASPSLAHWCGTDELGRDVLARLMSGARPSLLIALLAAVGAVSVGTLFGLLGASRGGRLDAAISLAIDLFWSIPFIVFVVLVVAVVGVSILSLSVTIAAVNWVTSARVIRAEALGILQLPLVRRARANGASHATVLIREVIPLLSRTIGSLLAYGAAEVVALETGLAFLGLGRPPPLPSWGGMLAEGVTYASSAPWLGASTVAATVLTLGALQLLARSMDRR